MSRWEALARVSLVASGSNGESQKVPWQGKNSPGMVKDRAAGGAVQWPTLRKVVWEVLWIP